MAARRTKVRGIPEGVKHDHSVLVLQGGGALGAYQAGVYEGMAEHGFAPDWVAGVSIGAINAALIAGNAPQKRLERLREFWDRVSSGVSLVAPAQVDPVRVALNRLSAATAATFGVPGFFVPRPGWDARSAECLRYFAARANARGAGRLQAAQQRDPRSLERWRCGSSHRQ